MRSHTIRRGFAVLLLFATLLLSTSAAAQTALIDTPLFQLNDDGGLVSMGAISTGVIPASGSGVRMMWHPAKAAFRAGRVQGTFWDEAVVGDYSVAMGISTRASGEASTALGNFTVASGLNAVAMGGVTTASGDNATAMGFVTTASGEVSTAMGDGTVASSYYATAMGFETKASGSTSTAMGLGTTASGYVSTAMGENTTALAYASLALGRYNIIAGNFASWDPDDPILVVGNGLSGSPSNAFTLLKNGNLTIAGTLTQNSDRRLKRDIRPISDALDGLARLQPVRFRFRAGTNRPEGAHIGLIAQEVQAVFPALVQEGADGYLSVSYTNLSAVLVQALNEQQAEIEALQDRLDRLEAALLQQRR